MGRMLKEGYKVLSPTKVVDYHTISALPEFKCKMFQSINREGCSIDSDIEAIGFYSDFLVGNRIMVMSESNVSRETLQQYKLPNVIRAHSSAGCSPSLAASAGTFKVYKFVAGVLKAQPPLLQRCLTKALESRMTAPPPAG